MWWLWSATLLLLVIAERWLLSSHPFPGDAWAARVGASSKPWLTYTITRAYQQVGRPLVAVAEVAVMVVWLWRSRGPRAAQGMLIALGASASCGVIKILCGPTPMWLGLGHVGTNFPSGVVTFVTACGGYLAAVAWRQGRRLMPLVLVVVIAGSGPARVLGGQHLLSDVLGGYMLGSAWLIAAYTYLLRSENVASVDLAWSAVLLRDGSRAIAQLATRRDHPLPRMSAVRGAQDRFHQSHTVGVEPLAGEDGAR